MTVRVLCPDCGDVVMHTCHSGVRQAAYDLLSWVPEHGLADEKLEVALVASGKKAQWIDKKVDTDTAIAEIRKAPFFGSQAWSYPLFGSKDVARSFHAYLHNLIRAAGLDPDKIESDIYQARTRGEKAEANRKANVQANRDARAVQAAALKDKKVPLEERIAKLDAILRARAVDLTPRVGEGFAHLYKYLDTYYGGGIDFEVNNARIRKLENEMYEEGKTAPTKFKIGQTVVFTEPDSGESLMFVIANVFRSARGTHDDILEADDMRRFTAKNCRHEKGGGDV